MHRIWTFISLPANLAVLIAFGTAIGFLLNTYLPGPNAKPPASAIVRAPASAIVQPPAPAVVQVPTLVQNASASGGVAINVGPGAQVRIDKLGVAGQ